MNGNSSPCGRSETAASGTNVLAISLSSGGKIGTIVTNAFPSDDDIHPSSAPSPVSFNAKQEMPQPTQKEIVDRITDHYLSSGDFNGYPVRNLPHDFGVSPEGILPLVKRLVERGRITVVTSHEENLHIKRFHELPKLKQLELLEKADLGRVCAHPSRSHLKNTVNSRNYRGRPFTLELALGEPQLAYRAFDVTVLEFYRNDPRYHYLTNDIGGKISYFRRNTKHLRKSEQTFLESFGFAYDQRLNRAVAVFLRYLSGLTPEHQQMWNAKRVSGKYKLHPDYYRTSIIGDFPEGYAYLTHSYENSNV